MSPLFLIFVSEVDLTRGCEHTRYFRFPLDADTDFCYKSRSMINAFAHSTKRRNYKPTYNKREVLYHFQYWVDHVRTLAIHERCGAKGVGSKVPLIELGSIKEFFEVVGYDYKRKKWL